MKSEVLAQIDAIKAQKEMNMKCVRQADAQLFQLTHTPVDPEAEAKKRKFLKMKKYEAKNGLTIHKLRIAGYDVKVSHIRYTTFRHEKHDHHGNVIGYLDVTTPLNSYMRGTYPFLPRGGATHIVIRDNTTKEVIMVASSVCHDNDSFDYKMGVKLALEVITKDEVDALLKNQSVAEVVEH